MKNPLISVIIPCYKVEKYLDRCVNSVINQTFKDLEIILVDDKSPDNTPALCDKWAEKDNRIKVIHKSVNEGLGFARNSGLDIATGDFVAFLDSDDYLDLNAYEVIYNETKKNNLDICYYKRRRVNDAGERIEVCKGEKGELYLGKERVRECMLNIVGHKPSDKIQRTESVSVCMGIFRRSIIEEHCCRFQSEKVVASEDLLFDLDLYPHINNVEILPNVFYNYYINTNSITQTYDDAKRDRLKLLLEKVKKKLDEFYEYDDYKGHYYSQIMRIYKVILRFESTSRRPFCEKMIRIKKECNSNQLQDLYNDPIIKEYPLHIRIYIMAMKQSCALFFIIFYLFRRNHV